MKCPDCGYELEEGKLYCPKCGKEIQIVPDFEPEIEATINGALEGITSQLIQSEEQQKKEEAQEKEEARRGAVSFYTTLAAAALIVLFAGGVFLWNRMGSVETQLARAQRAADKKNYAKAVEYTLQAVEKDGSDMEARNLLGSYYVLNGQIKNAVTTFQDVIALDKENEDAYRNLIAIYEKEEDYTAINDLIRSSNSDKIENTFTKYIANPPQFNYPQGTYEERIPLKLTANTSGKVYYTLDGGEPDETSDVYTAPIFLEDGIYTVRAFFVNDYGIKSETAVQIYQIHLQKAHEPEVLLSSGGYSTPQMITVTVPDGESVYYTVDGSTPTRDSIPYNNPIALPIGGSTYQFISYSEDGASSEVVRRDYTLLFEAAIDLPSAVNLLVAGLIEKGVIVDVNCSVPGKGGRNLYVCSSAIAINQRNYYLIVEYYEDPSGVNTRTGNLYCVDAETGELFNAALDDKGYYSVVSF
ncbi:MAG: chitobiase/beta-hexosaminidase C-terminal domain-containing protein [Lachnospiraceae bacterium]|nr:chitobiase/beta-hexosaminidase C-terminal domain-containing protein [Lachnospiraceae bacterium]